MSIDTATFNLNSWLLGGRTNLEMDTKTFAQHSGVASSLVNHIENGEASITIPTLVKICHGLGKLPHDFFATVGFSISPHPYLDIARSGSETSANLLPCLTIEDLEAFLKYYSTEAQDAKSLLYRCYSKILQNTNSSLDTQIAYQTATEEIHASAFAHASLGAKPLPYPTMLPIEILDGDYEQKGVITLEDVGYYLRVLRISQEKTIKEISELTNIAESILSRVERGLNSRVRINDVLSLENFYKENGKIFGMFWLAAEFDTGIARNKIIFDGSNIPPQKWNDQDYRLVTTVHKISRWQNIVTPSNNELLNELRSKRFYYLTDIAAINEAPSFLYESSELYTSAPDDPPIPNPVILNQVFEYIKQIVYPHLSILTQAAQPFSFSPEEQRASHVWQYITQYLSSMYENAEWFLYLYEDIKTSIRDENIGGLNFLLLNAMENDAKFVNRLQKLLREK